MGITVLLFFIFYMMDQILKFIVERLEITGNYVLIPNILEITRVHNDGMAWSAFSGAGLMLALISIAGTVILCIVAKHNDWKHNKLAAIGITMALAGCVGNLFDRLLTLFGIYDGVVDMIVFKPFDWICEFFNLGTTVFNLADVFLVVGVILFAIDYCFFADKKKKRAKMEKEKLSDVLNESNNNEGISGE